MAASGVIIRLAQLAQVVGEVAGGAQGVGVVVAGDPAAAVQGVLVRVGGDPGCARTSRTERPPPVARLGIHEGSFARDSGQLAVSTTRGYLNDTCGVLAGLMNEAPATSRRRRPAQSSWIRPLAVAQRRPAGRRGEGGGRQRPPCPAAREEQRPRPAAPYQAPRGPQAPPPGPPPSCP